MNQEQKNRIASEIKRFKDFELDKQIAETYKDYQDLSSTLIGQFSIDVFSFNCKKMISQLELILKSKWEPILPYNYQFQNEFGNGNLGDDLTTFNNHISQNHFNEASSLLSRLIFYQHSNGFWDKTLEKDDKVKFDRLIEFESKLNLISEQLTRNAETNKELLETLTVEKTNLEQLVATKKKELGEIEGLLPTARNNSDEINKLLNSSTATNESINSLLTQQKSNLDDITKKFEEEKTAYTTFQQEIKDLKELFNTEIKAGTKKNTDFDTMLASVSDRSKTFDQRIAVLNELIGKEGAVKLFNTFNDRRKDLEAPVKRWANIVFGTGVIALVIIVGIFTNFFGYVGGYPTNIDWHYLLINSIKSLPVMIVLLFTIKQYVRERTFQEEYAFRSAIALTVQAYGDIAGSKKEELIMKAITTIYSLPSLMKDKTSSFFGYRSKLLSDTLKDINETIKTIKS